jgi:hypothetical protein
MFGRTLARTYALSLNSSGDQLARVCAPWPPQVLLENENHETVDRGAGNMPTTDDPTLPTNELFVVRSGGSRGLC